MSEEGTIQTNNVNSEMEQQRTAADVDTVVSPGSNVKDLKKHEGSAQVDNSNIMPSGSTGTGKDSNMAGQSSTHGKKTTAGDK